MKTFQAIVIILVIAVVAFAAYRFNPTKPVVVTPEPVVPSSYIGPNFSIPYPDGYAADTAYAYEAFGPERTINGVKFTIPADMADGTNLSSDTYISVETIPGRDTCSADLFLPDTVIPSPSKEGDRDYSVGAASDAGAGNRYEETVYAIPGTDPCIGIRYFIHYGVLENYPEGEVEEFDKQALFAGFDRIRDSLVITQPLP